MTAAELRVMCKNDEELAQQEFIFKNETDWYAGIEEAREEERENSRREKLETARRMKAEGLSLEQICRITGLSSGEAARL